MILKSRKFDTSSIDNGCISFVNNDVVDDVIYCDDDMIQFGKRNIVFVLLLLLLFDMTQSDHSHPLTYPIVPPLHDWWEHDDGKRIRTMK